MLTIIGIAVAVFAGFSAFLGLIIPVIGVLWFTVFASWWWPFRADSAATLTAAALDIDQDNTEWRVHGFEDEDLSSTALATRIRNDVLSGTSLSVDGQSVPLTAWDTFKLFWAVARWDWRHDQLLRKRANDKSAAKARDYLARRAKSERTGA